MSHTLLIHHHERKNTLRRCWCGSVYRDILHFPSLHRRQRQLLLSIETTTLALQCLSHTRTQTFKLCWITLSATSCLCLVWATKSTNCKWFGIFTYPTSVSNEYIPRTTVHLHLFKFPAEPSRYINENIWRKVDDGSIAKTAFDLTIRRARLLPYKNGEEEEEGEMEVIWYMNGIIKLADSYNEVQIARVWDWFHFPFSSSMGWSAQHKMKWWKWHTQWCGEMTLWWRWKKC